MSTTCSPWLTQQDREQHNFLLFAYDHGSICLLSGGSANQAPSIARYSHLCFHAGMSDDSHLAPTPDYKLY